MIAAAALFVAFLGLNGAEVRTARRLERRSSRTVGRMRPDDVAALTKNR